MAVMKVYNGTSWVYPFFKYPQVYNGTDWVYARSTVRTASGSWGGVASDTLTLTVGTWTETVQYVSTSSFYGYDIIYGGSVSKSNIKIADDSTIVSLYWEEYTPVSGSSSFYIILEIKSDDRVSYANEGWSTITIGTNTYNRTDASFSSSTTSTRWTWTITTGSNPFGTTAGATKTITWA